MIHPFIILFLIGGGVALGIIGYTYHKGERSCISQYESASISNKLANQQKEIKNYQDQQTYNEQLYGEAELYNITLQSSIKELENEIAKIILTANQCVSIEFLRELSRLRSSIGKQKNSKLTQ